MKQWSSPLQKLTETGFQVFCLFVFGWLVFLMGKRMSCFHSCEKWKIQILIFLHLASVYHHCHILENSAFIWKKKFYSFQETVPEAKIAENKLIITKHDFSTRHSDVRVNQLLAFWAIAIFSQCFVEQMHSLS